MTTTVYNDLLTTGANMSVLDENAQGIEFSGLTGVFSLSNMMLLIILGLPRLR